MLALPLAALPLALGFDTASISQGSAGCMLIKLNCGQLPQKLQRFLCLTQTLVFSPGFEMRDVITEMALQKSFSAVCCAH